MLISLEFLKEKIDSSWIRTSWSWKELSCHLPGWPVKPSSLTGRSILQCIWSPWTVTSVLPFPHPHLCIASAWKFFREDKATSMNKWEGMGKQRRRSAGGGGKKSPCPGSGAALAASLLIALLNDRLLAMETQYCLVLLPCRDLTKLYFSL